MNWNVIAFVTLVLLAVVLFISGLLRFWSTYWGPNAGLIKQRLRVMAGELAIENPSLMKTRQLSDVALLDAVLKRLPSIERLDVFLTQAGITLDVGSFLLRFVVLWLLSWCAAFLLSLSGVGALCLSVAPVVSWLMYLQHLRRKRVFQIEAQLPDTLDLMARAMQAGHAFSSALLIVGAEGTHPIREEFQTTFDEINFGIPTATAMHHLTLRVASSDLRFFVVAVLIQLETGGNLTDILKSLAALIRDRQRIAGSVRVLTAEGRLSAWILALLPFVIALLLSVINPEFISVLWTDSLGVSMLQASLALMALGVWWMWRMVRIRI